MPIEKIEKIKETSKKEAEEEYKRIRELLLKNNTKYPVQYIRKQLSEKDNLRKVFLAVVKENPSIINEISKNALLSKPTCYTQLYNLLDLKIIYKIHIMDVIKGSVKDKEILDKFNDWTSKMPKNLKNYFEAKTNFWRITDLGKQVVGWAYQCKKEKEEEETEK